MPQLSYQLRPNIIGDSRILDLSPEEADVLITSKARLVAAIELEEIFHALVDDYIEFETTILNAAVEYAVRPEKSIHDFSDFRRLFNRRLMHVLTLARSYLCGTDRTLRSINVASDALTLKASKAMQYDQLLGYRVMEALRNSAQHHGFPLHGLTLGGKWIESGEGRTGKIQFYAAPTLTTDELAEDAEFKKPVLDELKKIATKHDARVFLREYVMGLSNVHSDFHAVTKAALETSETNISTAIERWVRECRQDREAFGLSVVQSGPNGTFRNIAQIFSELIERRRALAQENRALVNLHLAFVSGAVDSEDR